LPVETTAFCADKNERKKAGKYSTFRRKKFRPPKIVREWKTGFKCAILLRFIRFSLIFQYITFFL